MHWLRATNLLLNEFKEVAITSLNYINRGKSTCKWHKILKIFYATARLK